VKKENNEFKTGFYAGLSAFIMWGLLPAYWKMLGAVQPLEILAHRILWSTVTIGTILTIQKRWKEVAESCLQFKKAALLTLTGTLIGANWLTYIWAVNNNLVLETSIGYYINPLVNVLLGAIFLKEKIERYQIVAVFIAAAGVSVLALNYGHIPYAGLFLAFSFSFYGLLRKTLSVPPLPGLFFETLILIIPSLIYLTFLHLKGGGSFTNINLRTDLFLFGAGIATSLPLLLFTIGAKSMKFSTIGLLQYLAPTIAFFLGVFAFKESFTFHHKIAFICIWSALILYSSKNIYLLIRNFKKNTTYSDIC